MAMGRHQAVIRNDDPISAMDDMISRTREMDPIIVAVGMVAGMLVAAIWR